MMDCTNPSPSPDASDRLPQAGRTPDRGPAEPVRKRWRVWLFLGVVALAAAPRLIALDLMEFKRDEADMHRRACLHASGLFQPVGMMSSVGVVNPALSVHLFSLMTLFGESPLAMVVLVPIMAVAAVALTFRTVEEFFGRRPAVWASVLFATSTWAVIYSRKLWAQNLLPFFITLALYGALAYVRKRRGWGAVLFCFGLTCATLLHFSALGLWLIAPVLILWHAPWRLLRKSRGAPGEGARNHVFWRWLLPWAAGAAVALLLVAPYLRYQQKHGFAEIKRLKRPAAHRGASDRSPLFEAGAWATALVSHGRFEYLLGRSASRFAEARWSVPGVPYLAALLLALSVGWACGSLRGRQERILLVLWIALPVLAAAAHDPLPHYLIVTFPASFIVIALALDDFAEGGRRRMPQRWRRAPFFAASLLVGFLAATELVFSASFIRFVRDHGGTHGDYGIAYRYKAQLAHFIGRDAAGGAYRLIDGSSGRPDEWTIQHLSQVFGGRAKPLTGKITTDAPMPPERVYVLQSDDFPVKVNVNPDTLRLLNRFRFGPLLLHAFKVTHKTLKDDGTCRLGSTEPDRGPYQ